LKTALDSKKYKQLEKDEEKLLKILDLKPKKKYEKRL
jgi:hypothetical protein